MCNRYVNFGTLRRDGMHRKARQSRACNIYLDAQKSPTIRRSRFWYSPSYIAVIEIATFYQLYGTTHLKKKTYKLQSYRHWEREGGIEPKSLVYRARTLTNGPTPCSMIIQYEENTFGFISKCMSPCREADESLKMTPTYTWLSPQHANCLNATRPIMSTINGPYQLLRIVSSQAISLPASSNPKTAKVSATILDAASTIAGSISTSMTDLFSNFVSCMSLVL